MKSKNQKRTKIGWSNTQHKKTYLHSSKLSEVNPFQRVIQTSLFFSPQASVGSFIVLLAPRYKAGKNPSSVAIKTQISRIIKRTAREPSAESHTPFKDRNTWVCFKSFCMHFFLQINLCVYLFVFVKCVFSPQIKIGTSC